MQSIPGIPNRSQSSSSIQKINDKTVSIEGTNIGLAIKEHTNFPKTPSTKREVEVFKHETQIQKLKTKIQELEIQLNKQEQTFLKSKNQYEKAKENLISLVDYKDFTEEKLEQLKQLEQHTKKQLKQVYYEKKLVKTIKEQLCRTENELKKAEKFTPSKLAISMGPESSESSDITQQTANQPAPHKPNVKPILKQQKVRNQSVKDQTQKPK